MDIEINSWSSVYIQKGGAQGGILGGLCLYINLRRSSFWFEGLKSVCSSIHRAANVVKYSHTFRLKVNRLCQCIRKVSFSLFLKGKNEIFDHIWVTLNTPHATKAKKLKIWRIFNSKKIFNLLYWFSMTKNFLIKEINGKM